MKCYEGDKDTERMPTDPNKHDLLGFPGVEAEHPKIYIRKLWLAAENDRVPYPKFYDTSVRKLAEHTNKVVNELVKDDDRRYKELCGGAFLEADAVRILQDKDDGYGYGWLVWGEDSGAEIRLKSVREEPAPRWGVMTDSGKYKENN
jgi:hypothetical protein